VRNGAIHCLTLDSRDAQRSAPLRVAAKQNPLAASVSQYHFCNSNSNDRLMNDVLVQVEGGQETRPTYGLSFAA
jgi:hypothetical protein